MSYISADEQSEDGELRQSPEAPRQKEEIMDFSLSEEEDGENVDSLEIKPPQARITAQSRGSKRRVPGESRSSSSARHKTRSERHHQHGSGSASGRGGGGGGGGGTGGEERRSSHHRSEKHHGGGSRGDGGRSSDKQNGGNNPGGSSSRSNKERGEQHYQREKERYYREKQNYEQQMQQQQQQQHHHQQQQQQEQQHANYSEVQYVNERAHRERKDDGTRKRHAESSSSASRKHDDKKPPKEMRSVIENPNREASDAGTGSTKQHHRSRYEDEKRDRADRTLQDLRERLLSKRTSSKGGDDVSSSTTERTKEGGRGSSSRGDSKKRHRRGERTGGGPGEGTGETLDAALQGAAGMFVKEIINISTGEDKKHRRVEDVRVKDEDKLTEEERTQQELRKEKLLEAEREMARVKEQSRAERERRHLEKVISNKRKQLEEEDFYNKRMRSAAADAEESNVVTVSDNTEDEEEEEDDREVDDNNRKNSKRYEEEEEEDDEDEEEEDDDEEEDEDNKSERSEESARSSSNDSRRSNRSDRSSESRDRSASSERRSRSRSASTERSRSASPSNRDTTRDNSQERQIAEEKDKKKEESAPEPPNLQNLPPYYPAVQGCRSVEEFQCLNRIEEGTYGVVYRAKDKRTGAIVALKRLKMEKEKEGFPITSLREINTLLKAQHSNIVTVQEIVVGSNMDKIFIVMDYVEHDLKSLMETMRHKRQTFKPGEVKCLLIQLLKAVAHLHDNWILHRDLKTSNLLFSHQGILKVGDFGLAREYGSPLKPYTPIVVTLWYRAPELLLCAKEYSTPIDMWSVGCIFAELLLMNALFPGKSEVDQLNRIFKDLGTPNEKVWPGFNKLPAVQKMKFTEYPVSNLRAKFHMLSEVGLGLLLKFLTFDPSKRITAEKALDESFFEEAPRPINPNMFPTWPAKSELGQKRALAASPKPPSGGGEYKKLGGDGDDDGYGFRIGMGVDARRMGGGFSLKF